MGRFEGRQGKVADVSAKVTVRAGSCRVAKKRGTRTLGWLILFGGLIVLGTGYRAWLLWPYFRAAYLVPSWGQTSGAIRSATVTRSYYGAREGYWQVRPLYLYTVKGRGFEGSLFQVTPRLKYEEAWRIAHELRAADHMTVYYDIRRPEFSTLVIPARPDVQLEVGLIATVYILAGVVGGISWWLRSFTRPR